MWNPLSWVMEAAAVMAIALANGGVSFLNPYCAMLNGFLYFLSLITILFLKIFQGQGPDWQDFVGIICLLIINSTISFIEENNAGNAAASLMARLAPKTKVCILI